VDPEGCLAALGIFCFWGEEDNAEDAEDAESAEKKKARIGEKRFDDVGS